MKIAVASNGKTVENKVSEIAGRAPFYLIFENKKLIKLIKNPFKFGGGAGTGVAQMLANEGVKLVIAGRIGPNMKAWLGSKNIKIKIVTGKTVKEIIEGI